MAGIIYGFCTLTALGCAFLLLRGYFRKKHFILLWSGLCFIGLSLSNLLLISDYLLPQVDLSTIRLIPAVLGMVMLVYGLVWEGE